MFEDKFSDLVLGREEVYNPCTQNVISFHKVDDIVDGLECRFSNMAGGFPFEFEGVTWANSEVLYLSGEFSSASAEHQAIQEELRSTTSGYAAKRFIKAKHKREVRSDFHEFRLQWMLFVVWQKCKGNVDFRKRLMQAPADSILVEDTTTDNGGTAEVWGCRNPELAKARKAYAAQIREKCAHIPKKGIEYRINVDTNMLRKLGLWKGQNNIGKILMMCRRAIFLGIEPPIDYRLLAKYDIYILGKKIDFAKHAPKIVEEQPDMTPTEKRITSILRRWDEITVRINAMMPIAVVTDEAKLKEWEELKGEQEVLDYELREMGEIYIKEQAEVNPLKWDSICKHFSKFKDAQIALYKVCKEQRITEEEWQIISRPIDDEMERMRSFAIDRFIDKYNINKNI